MSRKIKNSLFIYETGIENIFITDFLPLLGENSIKTFLAGQLLEGADERPSIQNLVKYTRLSVPEVMESVDQLAQLGLIDKHGDEIAIVSQREKIFLDQAPQEGPSEDERLIEEEERQRANLYAVLERDNDISLNNKFINLTEEFMNAGLPPDVIAYGFHYAKERDKLTPEYLRTVLNDWNSKGYKSEEEVSKAIEERETYYSYFKAIFNELGMIRMWTKPEAELMKRWFYEFKFDINQILDFCKATVGINNPNIAYLDRVVKNKYQEETGIKIDQAKPQKKIEVSIQEVEAYYRQIRQKESSDLKARSDAAVAAIPGLKKLLEEKEALVNERLMALQDFGNKEKQEEVKQKAEKNASDIEDLLRMSSLPADLFEKKYLCQDCKDTGSLKDGSRCQCFEERRRELYEEKKRNAEAK